VNTDIVAETVRYLTLAEAALKEGDTAAAEIYTAMSAVMAQLSTNSHRMRPGRPGEPSSVEEMRTRALIGRQARPRPGQVNG
jgi:hypothetical protein